MDAEKRGAIAWKYFKYIIKEKGIPVISGKTLREMGNKAKQLGLSIEEAVDLLKGLMADWASAHSGHSLPKPDHVSKLSDTRKGEIALKALKEELRCRHNGLSPKGLGYLEKDIVSSGTSRAEAAEFMEFLVLEVYDENIAMLDRLQEAEEELDE